jgi:ParB-like chromosome segregation protein Spo0J
VPDGVVSALALLYLPITALKPFPRNSRTHSKRQIQKIADSIKAFGFANPVLIDRENRIVAGAGRVTAAQSLGMDRVPTIRLEGLSPDQIRAYAISDNRLAQKAGWDKEALAIELQHLITIDNGFDVSVTGFEIPEISLIIQDHRERSVLKRKQVVSKFGDAWLLGPHRLVCGDSSDREPYAAIDRVIQHWQNYTGHQAIHAVTGKAFDEMASVLEGSRE